MDHLPINRTALERFIFSTRSTTDMILHLAGKAEDVIVCEPDSNPSLPRLPPMKAFVASVVLQSQVPMPTLATSAVYLARLRSRLPSGAKGMRCTAHRIFLACLILAGKNVNDSSPSNYHWSRYSLVRDYDNFRFDVRDINLMERQLLFLLDWNVRVTEQDLFQNLDSLLVPIREEVQFDLAQSEWRHLRVSGELLSHLLCREKETFSDDIDNPQLRHIAYTKVISAGSSCYSSPDSRFDETDDGHDHNCSPTLSSSPPSIMDLPLLSYPPSVSVSSGSRSSSLSPISQTPASINKVPFYNNNNKKNDNYINNSDNHLLVADDSPNPAVLLQQQQQQRTQSGYFMEPQNQQQPRQKSKMSLSSTANGTAFVARLFASAAGSLGSRLKKAGHA